MSCSKYTEKCEISCLLSPCCYKALKETLFYTVDLLTEYKIHHWMDFGTLLGAVRHGDIIPWDNDADICILSNDKKKLEKLEKRVNRDGFYFNHYDKDYVKQIKYSPINDRNLDIYIYSIVPARKHKLYWERSSPAGKTDTFPEDYPPLLEDHIRSNIPIITHKIWGSQLNHTTDMPFWFVKELEQRQIAGKWINCPRKPKKYLKFRYGPFWETPYHWNDRQNYHWGGNVMPLTKSLNYVKRQLRNK
jgi:LicD family